MDETSTLSNLSYVTSSGERLLHQVYQTPWLGKSTSWFQKIKSLNSIAPWIGRCDQLLFSAYPRTWLRSPIIAKWASKALNCASTALHAITRLAAIGCPYIKNKNHFLFTSSITSNNRKCFVYSTAQINWLSSQPAHRPPLQPWQSVPQPCLLPIRYPIF